MEVPRQTYAHAARQRAQNARKAAVATKFYARPPFCRVRKRGSWAELRTPGLCVRVERRPAQQTGSTRAMLYRVPNAAPVRNGAGVQPQSAERRRLAAAQRARGVLAHGLLLYTMALRP